MTDIFYSIKDTSHSGMTMYRIRFDYEVYSKKLLDEVDDFMNINYPDHCCIEYGKHYLTQDVEHMEMAFKLRF